RQHGSVIPSGAGNALAVLVQALAMGSVDPGADTLVCLSKQQAFGSRCRKQHMCQSACKRDPLSARKRDPLSRWRKVDRTRAFALRAA
ncbi:hypothetical protein, partial [Salmonella enterica]|uniref:hypothetical protein n=1 Tax=Salmonella enterica TaxID=28901 RepID=UPI003D265789